MGSTLRASHRSDIVGCHQVGNRPEYGDDHGHGRDEDANRDPYHRLRSEPSLHV
jgi:hypothetical protein